MNFTTAEQKSINRRIFFAGEFRHRLHKLFHNLTEKPSFYRPVELCAQLFYDAIESIRCKSVVPNFGHPNLFASKFQGKIEQNPKYRTYYHNSATNSTVGMFIGVDIIKNQNGFYAVDLNLNAGLSAERRSLFNTDIDPFLTSLYKIGLEQGYENIICFADYWSKKYISEFQLLNSRNKVDFIPASPNFHDSNYVEKMINIPHDLRTNTLYVVFNFQHSPIDFFITNQSCTSHWLNNGIKNTKFEKNLFNCVDAFDSLDDVQLDDIGGFPNLVIKLGGGWRAQYVKVARINKSDFHNFCNEFSENKLISIFNRDIYTSIRGWIGQHHKLLFQKYIPPETNISGYAQIVRSHLFISPVQSKMLYCNRIVSNHPLPRNINCGIIDDDKPFIVNRTKGTHYENIEGDEFKLIEKASSQLCQIIYEVLSKKFVVTDDI